MVVAPPPAGVVGIKHTKMMLGGVLPVTGWGRGDSVVNLDGIEYMTEERGADGLLQLVPTGMEGAMGRIVLMDTSPTLVFLHDVWRRYLEEDQVWQFDATSENILDGRVWHFNSCLFRSISPLPGYGAGSTQDQVFEFSVQQAYCDYSNYSGAKPKPQEIPVEFTPRIAPILGFTPTGTSS